MGLTEQQKGIVEHTHGHLLVLAGPGSGKTRTIIEKIAFLFSTKAIPEPNGVLAITFTNSAANELSTRLRKTGFTEWDRIFIGTFHSFSNHLLSCYGSDVGIKEDFELADKVVQKEVIHSIKPDANDRQLHNILDAIEHQKRDGIYPGQNDSRLSTSLRDTFTKYQAALQKRNLLDYTDLIYYAVRLVRESELVARLYKNYYRYVFVDEFQDTDHQQLELVKIFANGAIGSTIVADDDQSIFEWRGADKTNIDSIRSYLKGDFSELGMNFRSDQVIVEAANAVIRQENNRRDKDIRSNSKESGKIYRKCYLDEEQEAQEISEIIRHYMSNGKLPDLGQSAIITRARYRANSVISQLRQNGIKCFDRGRLSYEESWDTLFALSILGQACTPESSDRFYNLLSAIDMGGLAYKSGELDPLDFAMTVRKKISEGLPCEPTKPVVTRILECGGYWEILKTGCWSSTDYQNCCVNTEKLIECLEKIAKESSISLIDAVDQLAGFGAVQILSGQEAKGREFDYVFFIGLEDGLIPDYRSISNEAQLSEERRIFYVAMTRAKKELFLSHVSKRVMPWGEPKIQLPSRFISAIPKELFTN